MSVESEIVALCSGGDGAANAPHMVIIENIEKKKFEEIDLSKTKCPKCSQIGKMQKIPISATSIPLQMDVVKIVNKAEKISDDIKKRYRWSVFLDSPDKNNLNKIKKITYHLDPTFPVSVRVMDETKKTDGFRLNAEGWKTFPIILDIELPNGKIIKKTHNLKFDEESETVIPVSELQ